jgi:GT2 family glycosyltransferase
VAAAIGERPYRVRRLSGEIPGLSANRNAGWRAAEAPLVLFTDNDTIPEPGLVSAHLAWHGREPAPEVAVLGHVRWAREVRVTPFMHWLEHGVQFDYPSIEGLEAGWGRFYGANVSAKREFVGRVGGFDEVRLPYGYEDLDFGYRAHALGLRLLYNRDAIVEHLRAYDLPFFRRRVRRIAFAEHRFVTKHPELDPWFFRMFSHAARQPRGSGRGRHLIRHVTRSTPVLGRRAWESADLYYRQELAPDFLSAWAEAEEEDPPG